MSFSVPILSRDQIQEVRSLVHGILEQNKRIIDEVLSELVDVESTNILGLYNLVVEQWHNKQKTVDNLCHFALTMMATVQLLWDQKFHNDELLAQARASIEQLKTENGQLKVIDAKMQTQNIQVKVEDEEKNQNHSPIDIPVQNIEALFKCQSCIHFRQNSNDKEPEKGKCESVAGDSLSSRNNKKGQKQLQQVQSLRQDKRRLEQELSQAKQQSQLAKMQLQLAELVIQDTLVYKTSYLSLIQNSVSRISQKSRSLDNPDYLNGEIRSQSHIDDDSFTKEAKRFFNQYNHDHEKQDKQNKGKQKNKAAKKSVGNPFKKKSISSVAHQQEEDSKSMNYEDSDSNQDQFESYRPESHLEEKRLNEMIQRFKIKKSKLSDKQQTAQESLESENSLFRPKKTFSSVQIPKKQSQDKSAQSSVTKFYDFMTKKVVRNRIKRR